MTAKESIQKAFEVTDNMNASGAALDLLATVRAYLRRALEALAAEEDDGK